MVKAYLRYEAIETLGVVSSAAAVAFGSFGTTLITAALERILIWNIRTGALVSNIASYISYTFEIFSRHCRLGGVEIAYGDVLGATKSSDLFKRGR